MRAKRQTLLSWKQKNNKPRKKKKTMKNQRVSPQQKKVQFDSARVSFQVEYDVPDDKSLRNKIPLWTEHWKKSKKSLLVHLLRKVSFLQWIRFTTRVTCLLLFALHVAHLVRSLEDRNPVIKAHYGVPQRFQFPAVTFCFPFQTPMILCLNQSALCPLLSLRTIFNQSLPFIGFRCKRDLKGGGVSDCSAPSKWLSTNGKCFTFLELEEWPQEVIPKNKISFFVQKSDSFDLFIHSPKVFPLNDETRVKHVTQSSLNDFEISFFATEDQREDNCLQNDSQQQCLLECVQHVMHARCHCVSRAQTIRESDLKGNSDLNLCFPQNECNNETLFKHVLNTCHAQCPEDCTRVHLHVETRESESRDKSETNITIKRSSKPDLRLKHVTRVTCTEVVALIGGLLAFWTFVSHFLIKFYDFIHILCEIIEIYCFK